MSCDRLEHPKLKSSKKSAFLTPCPTYLPRSSSDILAFVGTVISETVASNKGIGYLIVTASSNFDVPLGFAGLLVLAVMGTVLYGMFAAAEKYLIYWAR
jgi:ABC-type dipeptide/oligopeptide/nickel transport system permease component